MIGRLDTDDAVAEAVIVLVHMLDEFEFGRTWAHDQPLLGRLQGVDDIVRFIEQKGGLGAG